MFALGCPVCGEQLERSAEGAKQGESSDSTERVGEHMFGEQVFVLGQPNSVTQVTGKHVFDEHAFGLQVLRQHRVTKVTGVVTKVTSFRRSKGK